MSEVFQHGYALVIGVDDNQINRLALPTVAKDVQAVHDVLVHPERCAYAPENVTLLHGKQATRKDILQQLRRLKEKVKADPEATAVLYYSGHGMEDKSNGRYYLIPYDISSLNYVRADAIEAETFAAEISDMPAKRLLVILDCCHADGMGVKNVNLATNELENITTAPFPIDLPGTDIPQFSAEPGSKNVAELLEDEGRAVLNSSTSAQSSYVRQDRTMSLFTYHLIEALTGHAPHPDDASVVYVTDVMSWVTHEVKKSAKQQGVDQTPIMRTSGVFPIAQLIGGKGVALAKGEIAPDPLEFVPPAVNQHAHAEGGHAANFANNANVGQIGNNENYTLNNVSGPVTFGQ
ncbi:MAG: caspase family protein [Anaerolineaceae bacterium]|nr:caspase family protein [Anaerolineaceae bacterium]